MTDPMRSVILWRGVPIDKLAKDERQKVREFLDVEEERMKVDWYRWVASYSSPYTPREVAGGDAAEIRRLLDKLDYIEATQFTLLGAADDRWNR